MTDEQGPPADVPWWSRPGGDAWGAPDHAAGAARPQEVPQVDESSAGYEPFAPPHAAFEAFAPQHAAFEPPSPFPTTPGGVSAGSPWDLPGSAPDDRVEDSLGRGPRRRGRPATATLVAIAVLVALLAGGVGGWAGYLLATRHSDSVTVDGASLGAPPATSVRRAADSVAGVASRALPSVVQIKVVTAEGDASGSGFVIDETGLIVTNSHVVATADASGIVVVFSDNTTTKARLVGRSGSYDLAVLKVGARNLRPMPLGNSDSVVVGDAVIAVGSPLGLSGTVTSGIVSAKNRPVTAGERSADDSSYINAIQTDAAINPGNSGGPLVNLTGEVIGVNSAIATVGASALGGASGNIGVGFAIPINQVRRTAEQIIKTGSAQFPIIGASLDSTFDGDGARIAPKPESDGTPAVRRGGPADRAGLKAGDIIVAINGAPVPGSRELIVAIRAKRPGDSVRLTVTRAGRTRTVAVVLGSSKG